MKVVWIGLSPVKSCPNEREESERFVVLVRDIRCTTSSSPIRVAFTLILVPVHTIRLELSVYDPVATVQRPTDAWYIACQRCMQMSKKVTNVSTWFRQAQPIHGQTGEQLGAHVNCVRGLGQ